jgi:hypothetical protein
MSRWCPLLPPVVIVDMITSRNMSKLELVLALGIVVAYTVVKQLGCRKKRTERKNK